MLELRNIFKNYEGMPLLKGVSFTVNEGEIVCLLGSSGSGKSTLLRIISGLELPDHGEVLWEGEEIRDVPVHKRNFGLMFQDYALFPNRNVEGNVAFGLRMQGLPKKEIKQRVLSALQQVNMENFCERRVTDLSGGEQQRVALARSLAPRPRLLMLDEPLGALDRALREQLSEELRHLLHQSGVPALYVTHDQEEAFTIADRLVLLNQGRIEQAGPPYEVYNTPASPWVADFLGLTNLLPGEVIHINPLKVKTAVGVFEVDFDKQEGNDIKVGSKVTILLKPNGALTGKGKFDLDNHLHARVEDAVFRGEGFRCDLFCKPDLHFRFNLENSLNIGEEINLYLPPQMILCLGAER